MPGAIKRCYIANRTFTCPKRPAIEQILYILRCTLWKIKFCPTCSTSSDVYGVSVLQMFFSSCQNSCKCAFGATCCIHGILVWVSNVVCVSSPSIYSMYRSSRLPVWVEIWGPAGRNSCWYSGPSILRPPMGP